MHENEIARVVVDVSYRLHRELGLGLLESVYEAIIAHELEKRGLVVERQVPIPVVWDAIRIEIGFRADLIVQHKIVVELKSVEASSPVHKKQLLTYLRLADKRLGLLINFGDELFRNGVSRVVNGLPDNPAIVESKSIPFAP